MQTLVVLNASVQTIDPTNPIAEAVVVKGNKIAFVGSNADAMQWQSPSGITIEGEGRTLMPGIHDSHFHLYFGSMSINHLRLEEIKSLKELGSLIQQHAAEQPDLEWIQGGGLAYEVAGPHDSLTRHHLDAILSDRPILLRSVDQHTAWANTIALERAGILHGRSLASPSEILMDESGFATGQLNEWEAMALVSDLIPKPSRQEELDLIRQGVARASSFGITSVTNMFGDANQFDLYHTLEKNDDLACRIHVPFHFTPDMSIDVIQDKALPLSQAYTSDFLKGGSVKLFMDGVIESFTSLLLEPYANRPDFYGETIYSAERFNAIAKRVDRLGLQLVVHAIGDGTVRRTLDGFAYALEQNGPRDSRHRIEHAELLHDDDLSRFKELGAIAAMQPLHASRPEIDHFINWMPFVGEARYPAAFRWRDLFDLGVPIPLGSDWPVVTMDPFLGMDAAVNRQAWGPTLRPQILSIDDTLAGYTRVAAYAEFSESKKGQLKPGMLADMVLLSKNIKEIPANEIKNLSAVTTIVDGEIVFNRE